MPASKIVKVPSIRKPFAVLVLLVFAGSPLFAATPCSTNCLAATVSAASHCQRHQGHTLGHAVPSCHPQSLKSASVAWKCDSAAGTEMQSGLVVSFRPERTSPHLIHGVPFDQASLIITHTSSWDEALGSPPDLPASAPHLPLRI